MDATLRETMETAQSEQTQEPVSTTEQTGIQPSEPVATQEDQELDRDEDFQKEQALLEKEMGRKASLNELKRFRSVYRRMKDAERRSSETPTLQEKPELTEEDILRAAEQKGYKLSKEEKKSGVSVSKLAEFLAAPQIQPGDREWLNNFHSASKDDILAAIEEKYGKTIGDLREAQTTNRIRESERNARNEIDKVNKKYNLTVDYDKDIIPDIDKMIRDSQGSINRDNVDLVILTERVLAKKGIELGRQAAQRETQKITQDKRKANLETSSPVRAGAANDETSSFKEIMREEMGKQRGFH